MRWTTDHPRIFERRERLAVLLRLARATPTVATSVVLARTTGLLYVLSGVLVLAASLDRASWVGTDLTSIRGLCVMSIVIGIPLAALGGRLPRPSYHLFVGVGTAMITVFVFLGRGAASTALAVPYVFVVVDAAFFFGGVGLLVHLALVIGSSAVAMTAVGLPAGQIVMVQGYFCVVSIVVAWLARVADIAEHDALTGLVNRRGFDRRIEQELARLRRERGHLALVLLDVDHFKVINDTEGRLMGDQLLVRCSDAWRQGLDDSVVLSRYGGDKFAALLADCSLGRAADLADRMRALAPEGVSLSAGVAAWTVGDTPSVLLSRADVALYDAKSAGRDLTVVYGDPARGASELEAAIDAGELVLHYQPVIRLADNVLVSTEALVRWNHPRRGIVPPAEFIPQAERTGAIHALGAWTLEQACATLAAYGVERGIAVNVSVPELRNPEYAASVDSVLCRHGVRPDRLALEITEALFDEEDPQVVRTIQRLRELGVRIAIDDFGTGYSSLRWLERFPVDIVKIDQSFVAAIDPTRERQPMLEAIIAICRSLGMSVVAEGVETAVQASVLRSLGCDLAQGYLFGRPMTLEHLPTERVAPDGQAR